jgi:fluoride exporter
VTRVAVAVMAGSALGAMARYGLSLALLPVGGAGFPVGTLAANTLGSFLIGLYAAIAGPGGRVVASPAQQAFVMAGFCGGFTTFSIFSLETLHLAKTGAWMQAAMLMAASACLWLGGVAAGHASGCRVRRRAVRTRPPPVR